MKINLKNVPTQLDDCTKSQLIKIIKLSNSHLTPVVKKVKLFLILIEGQGNIFEKINYVFQLSIKKWWVDTLLGQWIHTEKGLNININVVGIDYAELAFDFEDSVKFIYDKDDTLLLQKVKYLGLYYLGPSDYFGNLTFRQFRDADAEYYAILEEKETTGELRITDEFIFSLYQEKIPIGSYYRPKVSPEIRQIIFMYYIGNRKLLEQEFEFVFKKSHSNKSARKTDYVKMWETILDTVAGSPLDYDRTDMLNVRSVFNNLNLIFEKNHLKKEAYDNAKVH